MTNQNNLIFFNSIGNSTQKSQFIFLVFIFQLLNYFPCYFKIIKVFRAVQWRRKSYFIKILFAMSHNTCTLSWIVRLLVKFLLQMLLLWYSPLLLPQLLLHLLITKKSTTPIFINDHLLDGRWWFQSHSLMIIIFNRLIYAGRESLGCMPNQS